MVTFFEAVLNQVYSYILVISIFIFFISMLLRGFLWKYLKVRISFGRLVIAKIRNPVRDYLEIGQIDEGFLIYKHKDSEYRKYVIRVTMPKDKIVAYKFLGVTWIDVDEEKNAVSAVDYTPVTGYDAKKYSDIYTRAVERPTVNSNKEKIILFILILLGLLIIVSLFLGYQNYKFSQALPQTITNILKTAKCTVTPAGGI